MVMSIRTIADIDQSQQLDYHAVRNEKKLKELIMTDLITSYTFKTVSLDYHGRSARTAIRRSSSCARSRGRDDEREHEEDSGQRGVHRAPIQESLRKEEADELVIR